MRWLRLARLCGQVKNWIESPCVRYARDNRRDRGRTFTSMLRSFGAAARAVFSGRRFRGHALEQVGKEGRLSSQTAHMQRSRRRDVEPEGDDGKRCRGDNSCKADFGHDLECQMYSRRRDDRSKLLALPVGRPGAIVAGRTRRTQPPRRLPDARKASNCREKEGRRPICSLPTGSFGRKRKFLHGVRALYFLAAAFQGSFLTPLGDTANNVRPCKLVH